MKPRFPLALFTALLPMLVASGLGAQAAQKRPLDHDAYDRWNRIQSPQLSDDGAWLGYVLTPGDGDGTLVVRQVQGSTEHRIPRGTAAGFTSDARFVVFRIQPMEAEVEKATEAGRRGNALPQDSLGILDLGSGQTVKFERVRSFLLPEESGDWVAYLKQAPVENGGGGGRQQGARPEAEEPAAAAGATPENEALEERRDDKTDGTTLVLRNLRTGQETPFEKVSSYLFTENGATLVYAASSKDGTADGVFRVATANGQVTTVLAGEGLYERLTLDEAQRQLAFLSNRDDFTSTETEIGRTLYYTTLSGGTARAVAREGMTGVAAGWWVSENGAPTFSPDGTRLFFGTAPKPVPEPKEKDELLENVVVDIWNWQDGFLQSNQLNDLEDEQRRTYQAVWFVDGGRIVQLADPALQTVEITDERDGRVALGEDDREYRNRVSWDTRYADLYLLDVQTGTRQLLAEEIRGGASISPTGAFVYWWDGGEWQSDEPRGWMVMDVATKQVRNVTERIGLPLYDEISDTPSPPGSYGSGGWTADDRYMVLYDAFDAWLVDPRGREEPKNLTAGFGRANNLRLRIDKTGWEDPTVPLDKDVVLTAFDVKTRADGFYRTRLDRGQAPTRMVMEPVSFGGLTKAEDADVLLFTKSTYRDFPNLWVSNGSFQGQRKLSDANPQQAEYQWGTVDLVSWTSGDGTPIEGLLYKPENFDPSKKYPMMVFFYERYSDQLHNHFVPNTGTSINRTFYASRGYLVFVPDIPYKTGFPGESAMNAVVPGILSLVAQGFVDKDHIGVQGHSWGGYQIAYMVTRTNIFAAAEAGAPVANMTSAYGGIRWESGRVRQMQYEVGQSRIGGTLWDSQHRFIENSPLFFADKIETPVLILHNDADGAVPWQEGIQLFTALRRLDKPTWLVNYNGQGHGVSGEYRTKDWSIRMQQFFDHYLMGAPAPVWMVEGVPATMKGKTLGLELVEEGKPVAATPGAAAPGRGSGPR
jgi:dipeptidyl aminopeptidase/acylaminoacyl peptidase